MNIKSVAFDNSIKLLSGLANNNDSIAPMAVKDTISNCAIVHTYKKEGGKDDARERAIEEFGTGVVWLFGIPIIKTAIDKLVYPILKLDPDFDVRILSNKDNVNKITSSVKEAKNPVFAHEKEVFASLEDKNPILKSLTNSQVYKGMFAAKFLTATAVSAVALSKIIKCKQKTTNERIKKDYYNNNGSKIFLNNKIKQNNAFGSFYSKKQPKDISFTGIASAFMYNPIVNTSLLDAVITGTRLKEARHGERKEVALKEGFQLFFIYALAKPIQFAFEKLGSIAKTPIGLDPKVLFAKNLEAKLPEAKNTIDIIENNIKENKNPDFAEQLRKLDVKNPLIELLDKNGVISTLKNKDGSIEAISYFNNFDKDKVREINKTFNDIKELNSNLANLKASKAFKVIAVFGNIGIAAWAMGILQPKVNIWMRKILNNGDNRNPAIVEQEKQMHAKTIQA